MSRRNPNVKDLLSKAKRPQRVITINTNGELLARHQELESELAELIQSDDDTRLAAPSRKTELAQQIQQVEIESEDYLIDLTLQALPAAEWRKRLTQFPPTEEQKQNGHVANFDELIKATLPDLCIEPHLDAEDAEALTQLATGQWNMIVGAVLTVNGEDNAVPFSRIGSMYRPDSDDESKSPDHGVSASDDSKAGNPESGSGKSSTKKASRLAG